MKKIIYSLSILLLLFTLSIFYLSVFGFETRKFNSQIEKKVREIDKDLFIELKEVKIILNPLNFEINLKTLGPKLKFKNNILELENIKTQINIKKIFGDESSLSNLEISSKAIEIKNLISFVRNINKSIELLFLEKMIYKGYLIGDLNIEFDSDGKIKDNYSFKGLVREGNLKFLDKFDLNKINLFFSIKKNSFKFQDIKFRFENNYFSFQELNSIKVKDKLKINGKIENNSIKLNENVTNSIIQPYFPNINTKGIDANFDAKFSFDLGKKYKIKNFMSNSKIKIKELNISNNFDLEGIFPATRKYINFNNHDISFDYDNKDFLLEGSGKFILQPKYDEIKYFIKKEKNKYHFNKKLVLKNNLLRLNFLNYQKNENEILIMNILGSHVIGDKTEIKSFSIKEKKNSIEIENILLNKNFKLINFKTAKFNYLDLKKQINKFDIERKNKKYHIDGDSFNADKIIENLTNFEKTKNLNFLNDKFYFVLNIDQLILDTEFLLKRFKGEINFNQEDIEFANLEGFFSDNKKLSLMIKSQQGEKVTTLFVDEAESLVKRYKFIKGFSGGVLDFYSTKKNDLSYSTLKIYDFKLNELPLLTKILTLASLQGIADILSGEGIGFKEFEMNFQNKKSVITIDEIYAIGPAISILMDGYIEKNKLVSLRGTLVPATTLNKVIGSIPFLGKILVGSKTGEGVFGVSFKIKGPPKNLETSVNPIKTLTPRFITRTLEKIKQN